MNRIHGTDFGTPFMNSVMSHSKAEILENIVTVNDMLISMFADTEIPVEHKPQIWGEVRKDTLSEEQFKRFLQPNNPIANWFRLSLPELAGATIIGDDRKSRTPYETKIAVYFEIKDGFIIIYPVGFVLPGGNIFKCGERADIEKCRKLTEQFVFFGPDATYASAMTHDALLAMQLLRRDLVTQIETRMASLPHTLKALHSDVEARVRYQAEASVLAPVLSLAVTALNDPAKRKDMGRWLRSEYLRDKQVFTHACGLLDIEINTDSDKIVVRYL